MKARRLLSLAVVAALAVLGSGTPLAIAASAPPPGDVFEREILQTKLTTAGEVRQSRLYSQLTINGDGEYTVVDPTSTSGLRNLHGFSRPSTAADTATWNLSVDGTESLRTVANFQGEQPVEVTATYALDGEPIEPDDLVGRSGLLTTTYTVRNVSTQPTPIEYRDAYGARQTETVDLPLPLAGQLETTLDRNFTDVVSEGAVVAGDGRGNTKVKWTLILFAPLGALEQTLTVTANVTDVVVPPTTVQVVPVTIEQAPLSSGDEAYTDAARTTYELTQGATTIDRNLLRLATGAGALLDGLVKLADGAAALRAGLGDAATGSGQLADGMVQADDGGRDLGAGLILLRNGSIELSAGMSKARAGGAELAAGLGRLGDGAQKLSDGLASADAGGSQLAAGLDKLEDGSGRLSAGLGTASAGGEQLADGAGQVAAGSQSAADGSDLILAGMKQIEGGLKLLEGQLPGAKAGADALLAGVQQLRAGLGSPTEPLTILGGLTQLAGGLPLARDGVKQVHDGLAAGLVDAQAGIDLLLGAMALQKVELDKPVLATACGVDVACHTALGTAQAYNQGVVDGLTDMKAEQATKLNLAIGGLDDIYDGPPAQGGQGGLVGAAAGAAALRDGVTLINAGIDRNDPTDPGLLLGLTMLSDGLAAAVTGVTQLSAGATQVSDGQNDLASGLDTLAAGSDALWDGAKDLSAGLNQLDAGGEELAAGAGDAAAGGSALSDGLNQLSDGSVQLADGAGDAAAGSQELSSGLGQLDDGSKKLAAGNTEAAAGGEQLSDGLGQLRDGSGQLAAGLVDAEDGSGQIADGLTLAKIGGGQVADGSKQLTEQGTSVLASSVNDANAEQNRNVALVRAMDERSRTDGMPAGAPEGATSSAVYSFELAGADGAGGQNATRLALTGAALAVMAGLALVRRRVLGL